MEHIIFFSSFFVVYIHLKILNNRISYSHKIAIIEDENKKLKEKIKKIQNIIGEKNNG